MTLNYEGHTMLKMTLLYFQNTDEPVLDLEFLFLAFTDTDISKIYKKGQTTWK